MGPPAPYVRQLALGPMKNFVYLLGAPGGREALVVDPAWDIPALLEAARADGRQVSAAFVTHHHHDHVNGLAELLALHDVPVYAQKAELDFAPHVFAPWAGAVRPVEPGQTVEAAGVPVTCLHTPGHTPGAHCLWCQAGVFTGDTLFVNACGRCDFPGSDARAMHHSLHEVLGRLPEETPVFPGHDYGDVPVSSLGRERARNPYYRAADLEAFVRLRLGR